MRNFSSLVEHDCAASWSVETEQYSVFVYDVLSTLACLEHFGICNLFEIEIAIIFNIINVFTLILDKFNAF